MDAHSIAFKTKLTAYIDKCIGEAFISYSRKGKARYQYALIDNTILLYLDLPYSAVLRKVLYRLNRNLSNHFRLDRIYLSYSDHNEFGVHTVGSAGWTYIDIGHTVAMVKLLGEDVVVNVYNSTSPLAKYIAYGIEGLINFCESTIGTGLLVGEQEYELYRDACRKYYGQVQCPRISVVPERELVCYEKGGSLVWETSVSEEIVPCPKETQGLKQMNIDPAH